MPRIGLEAPHERPGYVVTGCHWPDERAVQLEGTAAEIPRDHPAVAAYGKGPRRTDRAAWPQIIYVRVHPDRSRHRGYRRESSCTQEIPLA